MPKVSVIIPVYNVEKYLRECLDSVINQTLSDIEIICINDGSTDNSGNILDEYSTMDSRIKVIHQVNGGVGNARNVGIKISTGDYIYFLDSDDYIVPDAIEKLYTKAVSLDLDICVCKVKEIDSSTGVTRIEENSVNEKYLPVNDIFGSQDVKNEIFHLFIGWVWDKLYKRSLIVDNNLLFPLFKNTEDTVFAYSALILSKRISTIRECLIIHRTSISTSISVTRENEPDAFIKAMELLKSRLIKLDLYEPFKIGFINYFLTFSLWHLQTISPPIRESLYQKIKSYLNTLNVESLGQGIFIEKYIYKIYLAYKKSETYKAFSRILGDDYKFIEKIFSIKNALDRKHKVICILGIKFSLKRRVNFG